MAKRLAMLGLVLLVAGGCAYMRLERPPSTDLVKCGIIQVPFWYSLDAAQDTVYRESHCIDAREAEGYVAALPEPYFFIISSGSLYKGEPSYTKMP